MPTDHDWDEVQAFYRDAVDSGRLTHDEAQLLRSKVPLDLVRKLTGEAPELDFVAPGELPPEPPCTHPHMDFTSPDGTVWRLSFTNEGKALTNRVEN